MCDKSDFISGVFFCQSTLLNGVMFFFPFLLLFILFVYTLQEGVVCFAFSSATLPSGTSGTLRQNGYKQNSANVEIRRFRFDLHGCPVPLQQ